MAACPDIKVSQHTWPCTKSWTQMQLQMCHTHTHHNSLSSAPVTCLLMSGYLSCAYTTLVGLHVTKHRCHPSAALHTLPGMRCITQPTACMEGAACCEQLASLQKAAVSIVPVLLLPAVSGIALCGIALRALFCLGWARSRHGSLAHSNAYKECQCLHFAQKHMFSYPALPDCAVLGAAMLPSSASL